MAPRQKNASFWVDRGRFQSEVNVFQHQAEGKVGREITLHDERSLLKKDGKYAEVTEHLDGGQEVEGIEDIEISFGEGGSKEQFNEQ